MQVKKLSQAGAKMNNITSPTHDASVRERLVNDKLLEIAEMGNISATAFMVRREVR